MDIEKCKKCRYAYFDLSTVGGRIINGKKYDIVEKSEFPSSCGYGLNGARGISENSYCPKPNRRKRTLSNILYKLRKKGIRADRHIKTIFVPVTNKELIETIKQIKHLRDEFHYDVQFIIE